MYVPHVTESYKGPASASASEVDDASYPMCTLRHFPSTVEHSLQVGTSYPPHLKPQLQLCSSSNTLSPPCHSGSRMNLRGSSDYLQRTSTATNSKANNRGVDVQDSGQRVQPQTSSSLCRTCTSLLGTDRTRTLALLQQVVGVLRMRPQTWRDCVVWALGHWQLCFCDSIVELLSRFPSDKVGRQRRGS